MARVHALASQPAPIALAPVAGADFLRFVEQTSFDPADKSRIKSQYEKELLAGTEGFGAVGIVACGQLVSAASFGTVLLPRAGAVSVRIDVVATAPHARGLGLARATVAHLLLDRLDRGEARIDHASVVAVHPLIRRIVESLGFVDARMGTSFPVLQTTLDDAGREKLRAELQRQKSLALQHVRTECARCSLRRRGPWCQPRGT